MATAHRYRIEPVNPGAHLFEVSVTVAEPDPAGQAFAIPAWIPGSYKIRDLARQVVAIEARLDGDTVTLTKLDKSSWQADPCEGPLTVTLRIHAYDLSVRSAHLDTTHGFFDGACVFPAVVGQEHVQCEVELAAPPGKQGGDWRVATSMRPAKAGQYEFGTYVAENYEELIDHPVEMGNLLIGEFEVDGIPHAIAVRGHSAFDMARICHDLKKLCEAQIAFLGRPEGLDRYLFLLAVVQGGYGGLEHRWSSALMASREDLPRRGVDRVTDDYRKFLGLCSHEYFHLWNVKRMKPERFVPYDLRREVYTGLLWVFEGITSYYDDLMLVRSGLISAESFLEVLGKTITRVLRTPGRHCQDVEESSFDTWSRFYQQDANSPNAIVSYYSKGSLVALALDLTIRKESAGKHSLDDVFRACWSRFGETAEGMPERGIESVAREVTGLELEDFFDRYVRGTSELPLQRLLETVGVHYRVRPQSSTKDTGGKPAKADVEVPPYLGVSLKTNGGDNRFHVVFAGGPAEKAGIAPGDEAVAIDGLKLTSRNLDERLRDFKVGDTVSISVFRNDELMRFRVRLGRPPEDTCYLQTDEDADTAAEKERGSWLGIN